MQTPPQVTFRDTPVDDRIETECLAEAEKLERFYDRITSCRVTVTQPHRHHKKGNLYEFRIDVTVPGGEIVINRVPPAHQKDEDAQVALHEAFKKARRQLEEYARVQRHDVKTHDPS